MSRYLVLVLDDDLPESSEIGFEDQDGAMVVSAGLSRAYVQAIIYVTQGEDLERRLDARIRAAVDVQGGQYDDT